MWCVTRASIERSWRWRPLMAPSRSLGNGPPTREVEPIEGGGHGISGMEERASLYGGSLKAGSTSDGGYRIEARFPFERDG